MKCIQELRWVTQEQMPFINRKCTRYFPDVLKIPSAFLSGKWAPWLRVLLLQDGLCHRLALLG